MAKLFKKALSISLALCMIMTLFVCVFVIPSSAETGDKMFYINGASSNSFVYLRNSDAHLYEPGASYTMSCKLKLTTTNDVKIQDVVQFEYVSDNYQVIGKDNCNLVETYDEESLTYTATYTIPNDVRNYGNTRFKFGDITWGASNAPTGYELWIADLSVTKNGTDVNFLPTISSENVYTSSIAQNDKFYVPCIDSSVKILPKNEVFVEKVNNMIHVVGESSTSRDKVAFSNYGKGNSHQYVPGETYTFTCNYKIKSDADIPLVDMFDFRYYNKSGSAVKLRGLDGANFTENYNKETYEYTATYTIPADADTDEDSSVDGNTFFQWGDCNGDKYGDGAFEAWFANFKVTDSKGNNLDLFYKELLSKNTYTGGSTKQNDLYRIYNDEVWNNCILFEEIGDTFIFKSENMIRITGKSSSSRDKVAFSNYGKGNKRQYVGGETYTFTCKYKIESDSNIPLSDMFDFRYYNKSGSAKKLRDISEANFKESYDENTFVYTATYTIPADADTDEDTSVDGNTFFQWGDYNGDKYDDGAFEAYFADFSVIDSKGNNLNLFCSDIVEDNIYTGGSTLQNTKYRLYNDQVLNSCVFFEAIGNTFEKENSGIISTGDNAFLIDATDRNQKIFLRNDDTYLYEKGVTYTFSCKVKLEGNDSVKLSDVMALDFVNNVGAGSYERIWKDNTNVEFTESYDAETYIYVATFKILTDTRATKNTRFRFGDISDGSDENAPTGYKLWISDIALTKDGTNAGFLPEIKEDNVYTESITANNKYRAYQFGKTVKIVTEVEAFGGSEEPKFEAPSTGDNAFLIDATDRNQKIFLRNDDTYLYEKGVTYTFSCKVKLEGNDSVKLSDVMALDFVNNVGAGSYERIWKDNTNVEFTESYDAETYIYVATFKILTDTRATKNTRFRFGDISDGSDENAPTGYKLWISDIALTKDGTNAGFLPEIKEDNVYTESITANNKYRAYQFGKTVKIVTEDEAFGEGKEPSIEIPSTGDNAFYINGANPNSFVYLRNDDTHLFEKGVKYTFTCKIKLESDSNLQISDVLQIEYVNNVGAGSYEQVTKDNCGLVEYYDPATYNYMATFTINTDVRSTKNTRFKFGDITWGGENAPVGYELWVSDMVLSKDGNNTGFLPEIKKENVYTTDLASNNLYRAYQFDKTVKIVAEADAFSDAEGPVVESKAFYINGATANQKVFLRNDSRYLFEKGVTYTLTCKLRLEADDNFKISDVFAIDFVNNVDGGSYERIWAENPNCEFSESYDESTYTYTITFKILTDTRATNNTRFRFGDITEGGSNAPTGYEMWISDLVLSKDGTNTKFLPEIKEENVYTESISANNLYRAIQFGKTVKIVNSSEAFGGGEGAITTLPDNSVNLEKVNGFIAQFTTVKSNTKYEYSFKYKSESGATAVPYVEAFTATSSSKLTCTNVKKDIDGYYNYTCQFTTPANLIDTYNLRIGVYGANNQIVTVSDFKLNEIVNNEITGSNLINDSKFLATTLINVYDGTPSNVWTLDGTGTISFSKEYFIIPVPHVLMFAGARKNGAINYNAKLNAGEEYTVSLNLKYGGTGNEGDTGVVFNYHNGTKWVELSAKGGKVDKEYKNVYTITVPADVRTDNVNVQVSVKVGSAYVTGYLSNLVIASKSAPNKNVIFNGEFTSETEGWALKNIAYSKLALLPDGYFDENTKVAKGMFVYRNSGTWDYFRHEFLTLRPNSYYLVVLNQVHPLDDPEARKCTNSMQTTSNVWLSSISNKWNGTVQTKHIHTPENLSSSNNVSLYDIIQAAGNYGYFGDIAIYESNKKGEILSENIVLNGDLRLGTACWTASTTDGFTWRYVKQPDGFFKNFKVHSDKMVTSLGTEKNAELGQEIVVEPNTKYYFTGNFVNMNAAGVTPKAYYKDAKGNWVDSNTSFFTDTDRNYFEMEFTLPEGAYVNNGKANVKFVIVNGNKGKGYISDLALNKEGNFANLFRNADFANGTKGWTNSKNYVISAYNPEVFKFHYDDELFNDGNWSNEAAMMLFEKGSIIGKVLDAEGNPISGIEMQLEPGKLKAKTNKKGVYSFEGLKPGKYRLLLKAPDDTLMFVTRVTVSAGVISEVSDITLKLVEELPEVIIEDIVTEPIIEEVKYGIVRGYLYDVDATLLKNTKVYLGNIAETSTDENGMFEFNEVPPGKYDIYVKGEDGTITILKTIEVEAAKGAVYKLQIPFGEESNPILIYIIIGASVVLLAACGVVVFLLLKKKIRK